MAKSTPIPLVNECCTTNDDVFMAVHICEEETGHDGSQILGVFTTEKEAKKCAAAAKKEDGYKGKEAKAHQYTVVPWAVRDKFDR